MVDVSPQSPAVDEVARLRDELAVEQRRCKALSLELRKHRQTIVSNALLAEAEEEYISNKLTKKLMELVTEKARLVLEVEREEELISNTLQKQLTQLRKDKVELEIQLEQEQECMVNKLQRQVAALSKEKADLEANAESTQQLLRECYAALCNNADSSVKVVADKLSAKLL